VGANQSRLTMARFKLLCTLLCALIFSISAIGWILLPDSVQIPVHWGMHGMPDRFGGKLEGLLVCPVIALFIAYSHFLLPREQGGREFVVLKVSTLFGLLLLLAVQSALVLSAMNFPLNVPIIVTTLVGLTFAAIGNYLPKTEPSLVLGGRLSSTMSTPDKARQTLRVVGRLFLVFGILMIIGGFAWSKNAYPLVALILAFVVLVVGVLYRAARN
jgi:uncharacterized membrane protein